MDTSLGVEPEQTVCERKGNVLTYNLCRKFLSVVLPKLACEKKGYSFSYCLLVSFCTVSVFSFQTPSFLILMLKQHLVQCSYVGVLEV